ncbi:MAG: polysaccharide biosynthesis tyrosine autokinase [Actinomycetota bacterium]|nr:polysaccharide biosynthesis tyrosine autokinase [Actinomycetota bacterium]
MELLDYLNVIRVRKWVIIQAVVIVTVAAIVVSLIQPKVYQGEAKVLVSEKDSGAALFGTVLPEISSQPERGLQTQVQLMQLRPLAENTVRELGLEMSPEQLLQSVAVSAIGQTNIVLLTAKASSPDRAAEVANTMAAEYVEWSRVSKRESIKAAANEVDDRLQDARGEILALGRRIHQEGKSDELAAELQIAASSYTTLAEKLEQLRINEQLEFGSGRIVSAAVVDPRPVAPEPKRSALIGVALGMILGLGMAFLYEYLDNTLKSSDEVERVFGAPVLGTIPVERVEKGTRSRRLTIVEDPGSSSAESYRILRNSLDFINFEHDIKTVLVTSAAPGEGKSTVAANLAAGLAQAGKKVVLASCDFRRPTTEQFFGVSNTVGLSDVLLGKHSLKAALQRPGDDSLLVLTSGKMPANPSELLGSRKMEALLTELSEWADWILVDSPPLLAVADPASVARWVDGVLVVSQAGVSTRDAGKKAVELLNNVGARLMGVVVWGFEENKTGSGYGYADGYYYAGYYSEASTRRMPRAGARAESAVQDRAQWVPPESMGRRFAAATGRVLAGLLGFAGVMAVLALVIYFLDQYFGWGVAQSILSVLG